jgi:glycosyltransferase involved in cell wall biosynthesis
VREQRKLVYLGRSRLQRNRANLIQTLHTVAAFEASGLPVTLYLPPWHRGLNVSLRLADLGIEAPLDIRALRTLHRRWPLGLMTALHARALRRVPAVYARSPEISVALGAAGVPHHLEIHALEPMRRDGQLEPILAAHRAGVVRWLVPISATSARALVAEGAVPERIHVSPSGVDVEAFGAVPPFDPRRLADPTVVHLGRLARDRGEEVLLEVARTRLARVLVVGDLERPLPPIEGLSARPPVPHREVPSYYARADLVLLPYQPEIATADGFSPLKLFEAMAAGRPIVASDLPPIREVLRPEEHALLVPPGDLSAWLAAIRRLREDPALAVRLARGARAEAERYSWRRRAEGLIRALGLLPAAPAGEPSPATS